MPSHVLGKRIRSGDTPASNLRNKRQAHESEIFQNDNEITRVRRKLRGAEQEDLLKASAQQSQPCSKEISQTPTRTRSLSKNCAFLNDTHGEFSENENLPAQTPTPRTPRKKDALSRNPPATPKNRIHIVGLPLTPRNSRPSLTPGGSIVTVYSLARQIFTKGSESGGIVGREMERQQLTRFLHTCLTNQVGGCTYVSGPPGTGKSALVREVTESLELSKKTLKSCINCMSLRNLKDLYSSLLEEFCGDTTVLEGQDADTLQNIFVTRKKSRLSYIVILDEIDRILTLDSEILYKLFEWSLHKNSSLIMIGIANALDLTDRLLPRLKARDLRPELLPFLPYTAEQIKTVIETRLKSLMPKDSTSSDFVPFLHPAAIELCSRKISSQNGDLRKAFDICRRAINIIESETKLKHEKYLDEHILQESPSKRPSEDHFFLSSPYKNSSKLALAKSLSTLTVETAPRASISHISKITSSIFGNGTDKRLKTLNLQQKAALCALIALEKRQRIAVTNLLATPSKMKDSSPTIKVLYDVYCTLCMRDKVLHPLTSIEFKDIICSLETLSLISTVDGRNSSFAHLNKPGGQLRKSRAVTRICDDKRISSCVGEREISQAIEGLGSSILRSILASEGLD